MKDLAFALAQTAALFTVAVGAAVCAGMLAGIAASAATVTWLEATKLILRAIF